MPSALDIVAHAVSALPERAAVRLGNAMAFLLGRLARYRRADADEALRRSFPDLPADERRRILDAMYRHLALNVVEMLRIERDGVAGVQRRMEWRGRENLDNARAVGRGVLLLSAHTGNWELGITALPSYGYPAAVVVKRIRSAAVNARIERLRRVFGLRVLPAQGAYRDCLRALQRNEILGFVLDQNRTIYDGIFVEFFGRPACTSPGLAHLAAVSGAPVVPGFMERLPDGRHRYHIGSPLAPPSSRKPEALAEATQRYTRVIEDFIRQHPEQWIWIHRRWKTRPPTAPNKTAEGFAIL